MIYHTYKVPTSAEEEVPQAPKEEGENLDEHIDYDRTPLKDGILNNNTGFPIIIGLSKNDILNYGDAQDYYKNKFEILLT